MKHFAVFFTVFFVLASSVFGEEWEGKCITVLDGDTIVALHNGRLEKIRLGGVDCPEKDQEFGMAAQQLTSETAHRKKVRVKADGKDRYGRTIGTVYVGGQNLNEKLVEAGLAWHYKKYSTDQKLASLEKQARSQKKGLWAGPNPTPPWDFRRSGVKKSSAPRKRAAQTGGAYHGNYKTKKFHEKECRYYNCSKCTKSFATRDEAVNAGYIPCKVCKP